MARLLIEEDVPLAPLTTLELGGRAKYFYRAANESTLIAAFDWARARNVPAVVLGGGSNVLVPDSGVDGLVIHVASTGINIGTDGVVEAAAGESWDALVAKAVDAGLGGIECLSGIPGLVGATPIQNVGAYGQEVSNTIESVRVFDRHSQEIRSMDAGECEFAYRDSIFKRDKSKVILSVMYRLKANAQPELRYAELIRASGDSPSLGSTRETVLALRAVKSMVIDHADPNRRSAGSFFTNPIVGENKADEVLRAAIAKGVISSSEEMPRYPQGNEVVKLAAGWLVEKSGFAKGFSKGSVGVSTKHALALVHYGGGTTNELLALADEVVEQVRREFDVELSKEPQFLTVTT